MTLRTARSSPPESYDGGCERRTCGHAYVDSLPDNASMSAKQAALWLRMDRATFRKYVRAGAIKPWLTPEWEGGRSYYTKRIIDAAQMEAANR